MKLILTHEVKGLGTAGDVVEVKDGYGRNFLIPQGLAAAWTRGGEKQVVQIKRARLKRAVRDEDHAQEVKTALEENPVIVTARAGDEGRLFGSVTAHDIADAINSAGQVTVDKRKITMTSPIKLTGRHTVDVHLDHGVVATVTVDVRGKKH